MIQSRGDLRGDLLEAIKAQQPNAYGFSIMNWINETKGYGVSFGRLYMVLSELETKGIITSEWGEATPERGFRRKRLYALASVAEKG